MFAFVRGGLNRVEMCVDSPSSCHWKGVEYFYHACNPNMPWFTTPTLNRHLSTLYLPETLFSTPTNSSANSCHGLFWWFFNLQLAFSLKFNSRGGDVEGMTFV